MKKKKTTMNAMGNAARSGRAMEDFRSPDNLRQIARGALRQMARGAALIGVLEQHLKTFAYNEEEEEAVDLYCTGIALLHGGLLTERGRQLIDLGFADGRLVVLNGVQMIRQARAMRGGVK